jgi:hypothetical protein
MVRLHPLPSAAVTADSKLLRDGKRHVYDADTDHTRTAVGPADGGRLRDHASDAGRRPPRRWRTEAMTWRIPTALARPRAAASPWSTAAKAARLALGG